jgi:hypothetical protein
MTRLAGQQSSELRITLLDSVGGLIHDPHTGWDLMESRSSRQSRDGPPQGFTRGFEGAE